jgi:hypothetical protein
VTSGYCQTKTQWALTPRGWGRSRKRLKLTGILSLTLAAPVPTT